MPLTYISRTIWLMIGLCLSSQLSFGAYSAYREFRYDRNLRLQRQNAAVYLRQH